MEEYRGLHADIVGPLVTTLDKAAVSFEAAMYSCEAARRAIENDSIGEERCALCAFGDGSFETPPTNTLIYRVKNGGMGLPAAGHNDTGEASQRTRG
jgi:hypothetical protein